MHRLEAEIPKNSPFVSALTTILVVFLLFFALPIKIDPTVTITKNDANTTTLFNNYLQLFNKTYMHNETLKYEKYLAFKATLDEIESLNAVRDSDLSAKFGFTKFSDLSKEEFKDKYLQDNLNVRNKSVFYQRLMLKSSKQLRKIWKREIGDLPLKVDWRAKNVLTKIKNQKDCGACWAFSAIETIESMYAIKHKQLQELSVQESIDCAGYNNNGCDGGDICTLLYWLKENSIAVHKDKEYPLTWKTGTCAIKKQMDGVKVSDFLCESMFEDEKGLLETLANHGPVAVAVNALMWQNYLGGVIRYHCDGEPWLMNHAVQLVGYDVTGEIPFYIARNSWGNDFGDKGYLYLAIGGNTCGVGNEVVSLNIL